MHVRINITLFVSILVLSHLSVAQNAPSLDSLSKTGSYAVDSYTDFPDVEEFGDGTIYYPKDKAGGIAGVAISPGFRESQSNMQWWGPFLASHGFAVLTLDTNTLNDRPDVRGAALMAAIGVLRGENARDGSPLQGKIAADKMAIMGHSMGGGGTLLAANDHSGELKAAIPFTPWQPEGNFSNVSIPTLVIAGEIDRIAAKDVHAWPHYQTLSGDIPRMYLEIKGGNHFIANSKVETERLNPNIDVHDLVGRLSLAWLKLYVDGEDAYRPFVFNELPAADQERLSKFEVHTGK